MHCIAYFYILTHNNSMVFDDHYFMKIALQQAQMAYDAGEVPVGAVVVWDNKIIAKGHNQVEQLNDCTAHAEMIALTSAFNALGTKYLPEATLYVTLEPCLMCCGAIYWSQLLRIVYGASDVKNGYRKTTTDQWPFHPKATIDHGIMADECAQLMKNFFLARRK
jgi:tRNA(adenine34) deaminase